jgi:hypothetical protein
MTEFHSSKKPDVDETEDADIDTSETTDIDETSETETRDKPLGEAGQKAFDALKAKRQGDIARRKKAETDRDAALAELSRLQAKPKDDEDKPDIEALTKKIRDEAKAETLRDRALDKLEAKAARQFSNPEDARMFLAGNVDDFIDGTTVDVEAITDALSDLLKARPYLGVTQGDAKRFQGTADSGPKGSAGKPQLTEADVKKLSREGKHAEIEAARKDGRLNTLLGIT